MGSVLRFIGQGLVLALGIVLLLICLGAGWLWVMEAGNRSACANQLVGTVAIPDCSRISELSAWGSVLFIVCGLLGFAVLWLWGRK